MFVKCDALDREPEREVSAHVVVIGNEKGGSGI